MVLYLVIQLLRNLTRNLQLPLMRIDLSGVLQSIRPKYQQRHPAAESNVEPARRTKPFHETDVHLPSLFFLYWRGCNEEPYSSSDHSGRARGQFETLAELAYCALDEGQSVHFFGAPYDSVSKRGRLKNGTCYFLWPCMRNAQEDDSLVGPSTFGRCAILGRHALVRWI
jgi:hypothetical protein